ncbi:MAG: adenylyltransferase/cytidyltransferase family protein [Arthrospira sp. SH-MAG29]|nr:adenylyltransferase/cytidyltransferase family protein [Arthrospira sp. SH-MAG29]MBS0017941.1 adenylyltransferase/cytidyltransferase family protein [Arthrospira sp. SH-MAG29]
MIEGVYCVEELREAIAYNPEQWRPLVFSNGCFDLIHAGHIRYLTQAKSLGRSLVVGLNSDRSVRLIKPHSAGYPPRPIIPELQRAEVLSHLKPVDAVVIFPESTATAIIEQLQPDIYVKGGDYTIDTLPEAPTVQSYGGKIVLIAVEMPTSTSGIINRILHHHTPPNLGMNH